jgi:DNA modification methylase
MKTTHRIFFADAGQMSAVASGSIDLVVTSPPYPMIAMWDDIFCLADPAVQSALDREDGNRAFELMHCLLDRVWDELFRVVKPGGFVCINIGDAVRTINDRFTLYPNHIRILNCLYKKGFMGSGMLPAGAYVTLEHEYILIVRNGHKRAFEKGEESLARQESAFFWEERNQWFSDVWMDLKGARQNTEDKSLRQRSAAFPFDVPYRLINMYSVMKDTVLDPFAGMGTTLAAAAAAGRNSIGYEIDPGFKDVIADRIENSVPTARDCVYERLRMHLDFVRNRMAKKRPMKYVNAYYGFPVMTAQEKSLRLPLIRQVRRMQADLFEADYDDLFVSVDISDWVADVDAAGPVNQNRSRGKSGGKKGTAIKPMIQQSLFK